MWQRYCALLARRPLIVKVVQTGTLMATADIACQSLEHRHSPSGFSDLPFDHAPRGVNHTPTSTPTTDSPEATCLEEEVDVGWFDASRMARMAAFGAGVTAPSLHLWYKWLDSFIIGQGTQPLLRRLVLDQAVFSPYIVTAFFVACAAMERKTVQELHDWLRVEWVDTMKLNYALWPGAMLFGFHYIPSSNHRILYINAVQMVWSMYLSHLAGISNQQGPRG